MALPESGHVCLIDRWPFLTISIEGPWDRSVVEAHIDRLTPTIASYDMRGKWAAIAVVTSTPQMSREAIELYRSFLQKTAPSRTNRVAAAIVCDPEEERLSEVDVLMKALYGGICPFGVFEDLTAAKTWARPFLGR